MVSIRSIESIESIEKPHPDQSLPQDFRRQALGWPLAVQRRSKRVLSEAATSSAVWMARRFAV